MSINYFFSSLLISLLMIFFLFKPMEIKQQKFEDVPLFTISDFTMYELDIKGVTTLMNGVKAAKYSDRYTIEKMDFTDNSKNYQANMKSNSGVYKNSTVYLNGDIVYIGKDGLTFKTQKATYDRKTTIATADSKYLLYRGSNRINGENLKYNGSLERVESKNVIAKYQIEER